jgi:hypothetical protein
MNSISELVNMDSNDYRESSADAYAYAYAYAYAAFAVTIQIAPCNATD